MQVLKALFSVFLIKDRSYTTAEVIKQTRFQDDKFQNSSELNTKYFVTYQYELDGKIYKKRSYEQITNSNGYIECYRTIYYNRSNPRKEQSLQKEKSTDF